jgi:hypothetical protein
MKKQVIIYLLLLITSEIGFGRVGIGAAGGMIYPGLLKSELHGSRFELGIGYELYARHGLFKLGSTTEVDAHYCYRKYSSTAELPFTADTRFSFDYLAFNLSTAFQERESYQIYAGAGIALTNTQAAKDFLNVNDSLILPELLAGITYFWNKDYDVFLEMGIQFGRVQVRDDHVPVTGLRLTLGATMYLTE